MSPFSNHCDLFHRHLVLLLTVGACIATTGLSLYLLNRKRKRWVENVASIKSLFVYPIKSVPGVQVPVADVSPNGLSYAGIEDRSMILLNSEKRMITMRHEPRLSLIQTTLNEDGNGFTLTAPGMDPLTIQHKRSTSSDEQIISFTVWSTKTEGVDVEQGSAEWFSKFLNREALLVQYLPSFQKRPTYVESEEGGELNHKVLIRYQDGSPVHLINENSVTGANSLLPEDDTAKFELRNFRPNIVVGDAPAHQEEEWLYVRFNGIVCKNVRLCTRCAIPTIDQDKGVKVDSKSAVLRNFRSANSDYENKNYGEEPLFGNNLAPESSGSVAVGMTVDASFK